MASRQVVVNCCILCRTTPCASTPLSVLWPRKASCLGGSTSRYYFTGDPRVRYCKRTLSILNPSYTQFTGYMFFYSLGCSGGKDFLGLGGGQRVYQQERNDHLQARERLLDGPTAERERVSCVGFSLGPPPSKGEATDCWSVYRLWGGVCVFF